MCKLTFKDRTAYQYDTKLQCTASSQVSQNMQIVSGVIFELSKSIDEITSRITDTKEHVIKVTKVIFETDIKNGDLANLHRKLVK